MKKEMIGTVAALFIAVAPIAHAQQAAPVPGGTPDTGRLNQAEFKMLTDIRVGVIKAALQLTSEQEKLWPAVEEAIRARAETRQRRLAALGERMGQWRDVDPVQFYRQRVDVLAAALPEPYSGSEDAAAPRDRARGWGTSERRREPRHGVR